MNLNDYLKEKTKDGFAPRIECADGFVMSVQASHFHYCTPREDEGPYSEVKVGFPSAQDPDLQPYAETPENPTGTVYGYVPIEIVEKVIENHGGMKQ